MSSNSDPVPQTTRQVIVDGRTYEVSTAPFLVGEWVAAQDDGGRYMQGRITRIAKGVVTIQEEGTGSGRRPHYTVPVERVYIRPQPVAPKSIMDAFDAGYRAAKQGAECQAPDALPSEAKGKWAEGWMLGYRERAR